MAQSKNRIILEEAEAWRADGRITPQFHDWIKKRYAAPADASTARNLQTVLLVVAGILVIVGIVTLVSEFWDSFSRPGKFWAMVSFALLSVALGIAARGNSKTRPLSHVLLPLALPLYLFGMGYAQSPSETLDFTTNRLTAAESAALAAGILAGLGALVWGFRSYPTLAAAAPPFLLFVFVFGVNDFAFLSRDAGAAVMWIGLAAVIAMEAAFFGMWLGFLRFVRGWNVLSARLALATNIPWGFGLILALVWHYEFPAGEFVGNARYDDTYMGVGLTAAFLALHLAGALRLGLAEVTGVCGLFLVGDAIWLGGSKGGIFGAIVAIFGTAIVLGVLAQQGVLLRILKPRPPPGASP